MIPDTELVRRAREGDGTAFEALVGPHVEAAWRFAATMLRDPEEARDAVQEAAFKAFRKLGQLRDGSPVRPWFFAIVANQCRSMRRARWWTVVRLPELPVGSDGAGPPDERAVGVLDLRQALAALGQQDRMVLYLFYFLDLPQEEVAQIMGISTAAVKARVHRVVRRLRPALEVEERLV